MREHTVASDGAIIIKMGDEIVETGEARGNSTNASKTYGTVETAVLAVRIGGKSLPITATISVRNEKNHLRIWNSVVSPPYDTNARWNAKNRLRINDATVAGNAKLTTHYQKAVPKLPKQVQSGCCWE